MSGAERRGVFPGSFDPLTVAHVAIAETAVDTLNLTGLDLSISRQALGKPHLDATLTTRVDALQQAVGHQRGWEVITTDHQLLADVAAGYAAVVLGADKLAQVLDPRWYDNDSSERDAALRRLPTVVVAARAGHELDVLLTQAANTDGELEVVVLELPEHLHEVSASAVRDGRDDWRARA